MLKIIHLLMITVVNNCSMIQEHPASVSMAIVTCIHQSSPPILNKLGDDKKFSYDVEHLLQKYSLKILSMSREDIESVSDYSSLSCKQRNSVQLKRGLRAGKRCHGLLLRSV